MRKATWIAAGLAAVWAVQAAAAPKPYFGNVEPPKPAKNPTKSHGTPAPMPGIQQGGETFATATPIAGIPYTDVGFTCNSIDDYYPSCAYFGISSAPDVVYSFVPHDDTCARISLCGSGYDTCVHVYDGNPSTMVACNDDDPEGNCGLQSVIPSVTLLAGHTYYIVIDGFDVDCGDYYLDISECPPPCVVECPPGSALEGEPSCYDDYVDATNGGCNSAPPVYTNIECNDGTATVCGTTGTYLYQGAQYRDTDWYQFTLTTPTHVKYCINAETTTLIAILDGTAGCPPPGSDPPILCFQFGNPCTPVCCEADLGPGTYWLFVAPDVFTGVPCGTDYVLTLDGNGCPPVSVQPAQWSTVKGMYR
jgi:hypothetical protein